jgi:hypothetical protein
MSLLEDLTLELPKGMAFTPAELTMIALAEGQLSDVATLEAVLASEGPVALGHNGQSRVSGVLSELRQSRHEAARGIEVIRRSIIAASAGPARSKYSPNAARLR